MTATPAPIGYAVILLNSPIAFHIALAARQLKMHAHFRYFLRVRFAECDAQKVVFNSHYGHYIELASVEFMRSLGYGEALVTGGLDYQLVKQTIEWKAPARFDQVIEVSVWAGHLGTTSFTLATEFRAAGEEKVLVSAETVYVHVDAATLTKSPLPADFRAALQRGASGLFVDHADSTPRRGQLPESRG